ncbi:MAG: ABC transporter ATP-binding protein/permease [Spirochaetes bacterium]|nr:ABC transporter ATP-binding protein/permease [Spirochaetota bacterium]
MANFFENEEILKTFDITIVKRIMAYVRPHRWLLLLTTVSLLLSTVGSLFLPLISKRIVDEALIATSVSLHSSVRSDERFSGLKIADNAPAAADRVFIRRSDLAMISEPLRRQLEDEGLMAAGSWYVRPLAALDELPDGLDFALLTEFPAAEWPADTAVWVDGLFVAPEALMLDLTPPQARQLRSADFSLLRNYSLAFLVSLIVVLSSSFSQTWSTNLIGQKVMKALRMQLFDRTVAQSTDYLSRQPVGRLVTRLTSDVETIDEFFSSVLISFIKDASIMLGVIIVLFSMSPRLAVVVSLSLPPVLVATLISRSKARSAFRKQRTWLSKVNSFISEHIAGVVIVKLFGREKAVSASFSESNTKLMHANLGEMYVFATFRPLIEFFAATSTAVVLYYGAGLHDRNWITLGMLIAFVNLVRMFYSPVQDMSEKFTLLQSAMAGGERVFSLLDTDERLPDQPSASIDLVRGHIAFDHVWFAYREEDWVLRDISFTLQPGQTLAIVGATGAGKSTIVNLIPRLWDIQKGSITLDGVPIRDLPIQDLRRAVRPVMQDVFLFSGSIAENISLGLDLSSDQIEQAARTVNAHDFIMQLPQGYATILGEGASTLSAGQRQLLSFARVVAHDPRIIVLDEATSSIDTETERLIQSGLDAMMRGRTTIAIAHRLSTIQHADRILVMAEGRLAEQGSHAELIARHGLYYNLYKLQYEREGADRS